MICKECGSVNPDGAKFCHKCGATLESSTGTSETKITDVGNDLRSTFHSWSGPQKFLTVLVCCCIGLFIIGSIAGLFSPDANTSDFDDSNDGYDISLIKQSTNGSSVNSGGKTVYQYNLNGILKNIPRNSDGFTVVGTFYDDGEIVDEDEVDLTDLVEFSEDSEVTSIVSIQMNEKVNITDVELSVLNPDGAVVYEESFDFDMSDFTSSGFTGKVQFAADD